MNEYLKQFSEQIASELKAKLASKETAEFIATTKASGEDRTFEVVMSTSDEDRQGDALDQSKWDLKYFEMNPVVLWAHNYSSFPIGVIEDIKIEGDQTVVTGKFAPQGVNPDADLACALYQEKILRAVSPGYIQNDDGSRELLEVSFCPVPAGRFALSLRQVGRLGVSTRDLVAKGFFTDDSPPRTKAPKVGETCELDDGTPGVLAEDGKNPGRLVCVPAKKSNENDGDMNEELIKNLTAEHDRHGKAVAKQIDEFEEKAFGDEKEKSFDHEKAIEEFKSGIHAEHDDHLAKCMKAVDENYELQDQKKSIDEFKSAFSADHEEHVKSFDKAIDEFKKDWPDGDPKENENRGKCEKAIEEFTKAAGDELARHEKAHMDLCGAETGEGETEETKSQKKKGAVADEMLEDEVLQKKYQNLDRAYSVFYAFTAAYMDESVAVEDFEKLLDEAVALMKDVEAEVKGKLAPHYVFKSGRAISAKNKEKLSAIVKALEDHHTEHGKSIDDVTAALKEFISSGDGGEETSKPDGKAAAAEVPELKVEHLGSNGKKQASELETYLFSQRLARQVKTAAEGALRQINQKIKELNSRGK
jgi:hypothetical protein